MIKEKEGNPITEGPGKSVVGTVWIDIVVPDDALVTKDLLQSALDVLRAAAQARGWARASVWIELAGNGELVWHRICVADSDANVAVPKDATVVIEDAPLTYAVGPSTLQ